MSIQQLKSMGAIYQEKYKTWRLDEVSSPDRAFEFYTVKATAKTGVCQVSGIGTIISTNSSGDSLKNQFSSLKAALNSKYGKSEDFDLLKVGSTQDDAKYWMLSLEREERYLISHWDLKEGSSLPTGLSEISLQAGAVSSTEGFVNVIYKFSNYDLCQSELNKSNGNGL